MYYLLIAGSGHTEDTLVGFVKSSFRFESQIQYNLNGSNPDGSFTVDDSNSFSVPTKSFQ